MSTEKRNQGKEFYAQALQAIRRVNLAEEKKYKLSEEAGKGIDDENFTKVGEEIQLCDSTISKQVEVAFNNFKDAMKCFTEGRKIAGAEGNGQEWVYCTRNYGMSALKIASLLQFQLRYSQVQVVYYFKEAIQSLIEGNTNGKRCHFPDEWIHRSEEDLYLVIKELQNYSIRRSTSRGERCGLLESFRQVASHHPRVLTHLYLCLTEECLKHVVMMDEDNDDEPQIVYVEVDWRTPKNSLCDLSVYLDFAKTNFDSIHEDDPYKEEFQSGIYDLTDSHQAYTLRVDAAQLIAQGLQTQHILLFNEEDFSTDLAWDVVDQLRAARRIAESGSRPSLELQAKAIILLGIFYASILKINTVGRTLCRNGVELITAIRDGRVAGILNTDWYQKAKTILQTVSPSAPSSSDPNFPIDEIKAELSKELQAIKDAIDKSQGKSYRAFNFIKHIYEKHPPRNADYVGDDLDKDNDAQLKKCILRKVLFSYSPDKEWNFWTASDHESKKWFVLCGEIVRIAGDFYEYFKGF